jgi:hypothetical protein
MSPFQKRMAILDPTAEPKAKALSPVARGGRATPPGEPSAVDLLRIAQYSDQTVCASTHNRLRFRSPISERQRTGALQKTRSVLGCGSLLALSDEEVGEESVFICVYLCLSVFICVYLYPFSFPVLGILSKNHLTWRLRVLAVHFDSVHEAAISGPQASLRELRTAGLREGPSTPGSFRWASALPSDPGC